MGMHEAKLQLTQHNLTNLPNLMNLTSLSRISSMELLNQEVEQNTRMTFDSKIALKIHYKMKS